MVKTSGLNILIAPDKFKGSLTAIQVCDCIAGAISKERPNALISKLPLADGGEGSLEVLEPSLQFERRYLMVNNPVFESIEAFYGIKGKVAYIEMAKASGLQLLKKKQQRAGQTTTLGTGEMILDAIEQGAKEIYLFVGGSATNDGGIGMAHALGYRLLDKNGQELKPVGDSLLKIRSIRGLTDPKLKGVSCFLVSDVKNPLIGANGATRVYAAQKGASSSDMEHLEKGMKNYSEIASRHFNRDIANIEGSGAAGGLGAGAMLYLNAKTLSGIDTIMDMAGIDDKIKSADCVITGEGKLDQQTLQGKVIAGVMDRCFRYKKPLGILCGINELDENTIGNLPVRKVLAIKTDSVSIDRAIRDACSILTERTKEILPFLLG